MQALFVVDLRDKAVDVAAGVAQVGKCFAVDLFGLERFHEAFSLGVVEGIAWPAHADGDVAIGKPLAIGDRRVLHAAVGVMDQAAGGRPPSRDGFLQRGDGKRGIERVLKSPANSSCARTRQNDGEIGEGFGEMDIGDVRDPDLVGCGRHQATDQIGNDEKARWPFRRRLRNGALRRA